MTPAEIDAATRAVVCAVARYGQTNCCVLCGQFGSHMEGCPVPTACKLAALYAQEET